MDTILFQNILFFTISLFFIFITVGFAICLVYMILVLKSIHHFFKIIKDEGEKIAGDIDGLRAQAKSGGVKFASLVLSILTFLKHTKKSKEK